MKILCIFDWTIVVLGKNNKQYVFDNVSPFFQRKIKNFVKRKYFGRAWNLLKECQYAKEGCDL